MRSAENHDIMHRVRRAISVMAASIVVAATLGGCGGSTSKDSEALHNAMKATEKAPGYSVSWRQALSGQDMRAVYQAPDRLQIIEANSTSVAIGDDLYRKVGSAPVEKTTGGEALRDATFWFFSVVEGAKVKYVEGTHYSFSADGYSDGWATVQDGKVLAVGFDKMPDDPSSENQMYNFTDIGKATTVDIPR